MACATSLSFEECCETQRCAEIRQRLHDRLDQGLHTLEARVQAPTPPLAQLTPAVLALRQEMTQAGTEGVVEQAHRAVREPRTATCPPCGQTWSAGGPQPRTVETLVGAIRLRRPFCDCERCCRGPTAVDEARQVTERRKPPDVQKAAVQLTKALPDETACALFEELPGRPLSAQTAHEVPPAVAHGVTVVDGAPSREAIVAKSAALAEGPPWRPMLGLAIDGAAVPTGPETAQGRRPGRKNARAQRARWTGAWREAPGFRCSLRAADRRVQVLSWHQVHTAAAAAEARRQVKAAGVIPEPPVRRWVMADGAPWRWTHARAWCPSAEEMWDDAHGREPRQPVAALQDGAHPERPQPWDEAALARVCDGDVHGVIWGWPRMKPTDTQAAAELETLVGDLQRPQERLDDRLARKGGYPVGRGGIAAAHQGIGPVRLKRSGAWWDCDHRQPDVGRTRREIYWHLRRAL